MKIASAICLMLMLCGPGFGEAGQRPGRAAARRAVYLREGYYFEITPCVRCHRCAPCALTVGWQREVLSDLKGSGISSFLAAPYQMNRTNLTRVRAVSRVQSYETSIYVGPYESRQTAMKEFKLVCEAASDYGDECREWPEKEYSIGFSGAGLWVSLNYVPPPAR